jgi:YD repeat-containing protein
MTALQLPSSPPAAVKAIRFEKSGSSIFYYGVYEILTGRAQVVGAETSTEYPETGSTPIVTTTQYTYNSNNKLSQVTETMADGSTRVQTMKYVDDLPISGTPTQPSAIALKALKDNHRHGEVIEQATSVTVAGDSSILTDASFVAYKTFSNGKTMPAYILTIPRGVSFTAASTSGSSLSTDTDYDTVRFFNDYDNEGRTIWESDKKKNTVSHSYATTYGYETATFANVKSGTSVYEGFEATSTAGLTVSGGTPNFPSGWTGDKAIDLTTSLTLTSATLSKGPTTQYRISCWAKAATATTVYFKAQGGSLVDIDNFAIAGNNQWQYYEKTVSAASLPTSFTLKVTTAGSVTLDDVLLVPAEARVALQTARPLVGVTSTTDDRGNSVAFSYDEQGRKTGTFDRKRNLVQRVEYGTQKPLTTELVAAFTHNSSYLVTNSAVTFSAYDHCNLQGATYAWVVDGATESTNSTLVRTFTVPGQHNVSLTVTKNGSSSNFYQDLCFDLGGSPGISAEDSQSNSYESGFTANCNTPTLTFTAEGLPASGGGCTTTVTWRAVNTIMVNGVPEINVLSQLGTGGSINYAPSTALTVQAMVQINCSGTGNLACLGASSNYFVIGFDVNWETVNCN